MSGAQSDLHAADAQYHADCYRNFVNPTNVKVAAKSSQKEPANDPALNALITEMSSNKSRIWNSLETEDSYASYGGTALSRRTLTDKLLNHFGDDLLLLKGNGVAHIFLFRSKAPHLLKLADKIEDTDFDLKSIAKTIKKECSERSVDRDTYKTRLYAEDTTEACSDTPLKLLAKLSPKLDHTNTALLIGNIITSVITNKPTMLQITLGTILREKALIEQCSAFGITCSYDEVLRFKKSVAHAASQDKQLQGLMDRKFGLVQTVADNFDANIASPNGLKATHSLALFATQVQENTNDIQISPSIRRLRKDETEDPAPAVAIQHYNGSQKPAMPDAFAQHSELPEQVRAAQIISMNRAQEADFTFLRRITHDASTPEYNGFNTEMARSQGHSVKPSTKAVYTPLIDMKPSNPDTIRTAMVEAQRMTQITNQSVTLFTVDQQLYKVTLNVLWAYPEQFQNFIPRLGGMHMLMSFVGAVGTLMNNSGLEELMNSAFGGVPKMLSGKKYPQNLRALRMVVEELLRFVISETENFSDLMTILDERYTILMLHVFSFLIF